MQYLYLTIAVLMLARAAQKQNELRIAKKTANISSIYFNNANKKSIDLSKIYMFLIAIILIMFAGLRNGYNDTTTYMAAYYNKAYLVDLWSNISIDSELIFEFMQYSMNSIGLSHNVFFTVNAIIFVVPCVVFIYKNSKDFFLSMIIFMCSGVYLFALGGMRQMTAIGILMIAYMLAEKRHYILMLFFAVIAQQIHSYSVLFILLLFVKNMKLWDQGMWLVLICSMALAAVLPVFGGVIESIADILGNHDYTTDTLFSSDSVTIPRLLVVFYPVIASVVWRKKIKEDFDEKDVKIFNIGMIQSIAVLFAIVAVPNLFNRLGYFFSIFYCVGTGNMLSAVLNREQPGTRLFLKVLIVVLYVGYILYDVYTHTWNFANPFSF